MTKLYHPKSIKQVIQKVVDEFRSQVVFDSSMPKWLADLPSGKYTNKELVAISKTGERNVAKIMKKYCNSIEYVDSKKLHLKKCVYTWHGLDEKKKTST